MYPFAVPIHHHRLPAALFNLVTRWADPFTSWGESTWCQFLQALGLRERVRVAHLSPSISYQQGSDTDGNISQHKREMEVSLGTKISLRQQVSLREGGKFFLQNPHINSFPDLVQESYSPSFCTLCQTQLCLQRTSVEVITSVTDATLQRDQVSFSAGNRRNG